MPGALGLCTHLRNQARSLWAPLHVRQPTPKPCGCSHSLPMLPEKQLGARTPLRPHIHPRTQVQCCRLGCHSPFRRLGEVQALTAWKKSGSRLPCPEAAGLYHFQVLQLVHDQPLLHLIVASMEQLSQLFCSSWCHWSQVWSYLPLLSMPSQLLLLSVMVAPGLYLGGRQGRSAGVYGAVRLRGSGRVN